MATDRQPISSPTNESFEPGAALGGRRPGGRDRTVGQAQEAPAQAVRVSAASSRPSSATEVSRILNFWTLPVTVMGKASTNLQ